MKTKITTLLVVLSSLLFANEKVVKYSDFGAKGDGKTDDFAAIIKAHNYANEKNLPVEADKNAIYYIGGSKNSATIQTNTNWGNAKFIIDDKNLEIRSSKIFIVSSKLKSFQPEGITNLKIGMKNLGVNLPCDSLILAENDKIRHYIRKGANQNAGNAQADIFIAKQDGSIDESSPIVWDFDNISSIKAYPIDSDKLTVEGGVFTTIANNMDGIYLYHHRGIVIERSNVVIKNLKHFIIEEGEIGQPYLGFIVVREASNVLIKDSVFSGHKTYVITRENGAKSQMGSYDLFCTNAINVTFENCTQSNDINDKKYWGIMATNNTKNITYLNCKLSRFDAHMGIYNASIINSEIGIAGITLIGSGKFVMKNSTVHRNPMIDLRQDYGSTWQGEIEIKDCTFKVTPDNVNDKREPVLISGMNNGMHNFGYVCYMPEKITIENLTIDDNVYTKPIKINIFAYFNSLNVNDSFEAKFPYITTKEVILKNVKSLKGNPLNLSYNKYMFRDVKVTK